jgi:ATP-dependent Lhr-like helicase
LDRYGVLFRSLLEREIPGLRWAALFRTLRVLELSGEIVSGHFFDGVPGLQFASHEAVRRLRDGLDEDRVWWVNATDPASPASLGLEFADWVLPRRVPGNHLVFHGRNLVVRSERRGASLAISVAPDHPRLHEYFGFFENLLARAVQPVSRIDVEEINGEAAPATPYRRIFDRFFHVTRQPTVLRLSRKY